MHTRGRSRSRHPHIHLIVPAGSFHTDTARWHSQDGKYLFNAFALAKVFRTKFLAALKHKGIQCPQSLPSKWVAQCQSVGRGEPALKYLARYLYRGVINESKISSHLNGQVSFRYKDSKTKTWKIRKEPAAKFLWLVLQHVLPKGFRRARDYGFLHCLARQALQRIQLLLKVSLKPPGLTSKKLHLCPCCGKPMHFILFSKLPCRLVWRTR